VNSFFTGLFPKINSIWLLLFSSSSSSLNFANVKIQFSIGTFKECAQPLSCPPESAIFTPHSPRMCTIPLLSARGRNFHSAFSESVHNLSPVRQRAQFLPFSLGILRGSAQSLYHPPERAIFIPHSQRACRIPLLSSGERNFHSTYLERVHMSSPVRYSEQFLLRSLRECALSLSCPLQRAIFTPHFQRVRTAPLLSAREPNFTPHSQRVCTISLCAFRVENQKLNISSFCPCNV
jgi:hypothetical protein